MTTHPSKWRLSSALALSASLLMGTTAPAFARGGFRGGGGGAMRGGGAYRGGGASPAAAPSTPAPRPSTPPPAAHGRTGNVNAGQRPANVNVNRDVNITRNTVVRPAPRPYARAPYAYGGRRYYAHHAYGYHAYRPYAWGVAYRPFGVFAATLAATAVAVSVANTHYWYNYGVWYMPVTGGYTVVTAPVGGTVATLPPEAVLVSPDTYYYGGTYYEQSGGAYTVVTPVAGTVVEHLPEGGEEVTLGDQKYVKFGETYYQPIEQDGKPMYEVVEVR
jgi:hypothetical protein